MPEWSVMKQGVGLSLSLMWASSASAQRAADDFCYQRERAATEAGAALEYAAKMVVAQLMGLHDVFTDRPTLSDAELWVAAMQPALAARRRRMTSPQREHHSSIGTRSRLT
jgi:hypothetical protein